ncbi:MAG TPA: HNH endonuclease signature motif containing protein, partial [Streptosporangiaceae bacterium]|nr:HNH endonuclease signature motif containing protein [Streptosporangiaceae bacterium]
AALARLIRARTSTCSFPGCRRPARRCDLDHSVPYEDGGATCQCNLSPLCRRHHRVKQAEGWTLSQVSPGVLVWLTPAGRRYTTLPSQHPT